FARPRQDELERRGDRARPPHRGDWRDPDGQAHARARAYGWTLRHREPVYRRRPGHRDDFRARELAVRARTPEGPAKSLAPSLPPHRACLARCCWRLARFIAVVASADLQIARIRYRTTP